MFLYTVNAIIFNMNMSDKQKRVDYYIGIAKQKLDQHTTHIDENILFIIGALTYHGFEIQSACGGHLSKRRQGVYIDIQFPKYSKMMEIYKTLTNQDKIEKHQETIDHQLALLELQVIILLNDFYSQRKVKYENILIPVHRSNNLLRLQPVSSNIIGRFADVDKRKMWLKDLNQELFDLGAFLFEKNPSKPNAA